MALTHSLQTWSLHNFNENCQRGARVSQISDPSKHVFRKSAKLFIFYHFRQLYLPLLLVLLFLLLALLLQLFFYWRCCCCCGASRPSYATENLTKPSFEGQTSGRRRRVVHRPDPRKRVVGDHPREAVVTV